MTDNIYLVRERLVESRAEFMKFKGNPRVSEEDRLMINKVIRRIDFLLSEIDREISKINETLRIMNISMN